MNLGITEQSYERAYIRNRNRSGSSTARTAETYPGEMPEDSRLKKAMPANQESAIDIYNRMRHIRTLDIPEDGIPEEKSSNKSVSEELPEKERLEEETPGSFSVKLLLYFETCFSERSTASPRLVSSPILQSLAMAVGPEISRLMDVFIPPNVMVMTRTLEPSGFTMISESLFASSSSFGSSGVSSSNLSFSFFQYLFLSIHHT